MVLCNELCLSDRPAGRLSCMAKTLTLDMTRKLFNYFFHTCQAPFTSIILYHFH